MTLQTIKIPGPDHPITLERNDKRVIVTVGGRVIADTRRAFTLLEAKYPPVHYIPREDVDMAALARSATQTYCPYKAMRPTSAFRPPANVRPMRSGPTKRPMRR